MYRIDLHSHSVASDGAYTPKLLCDKAKEANVDLFSITDHDSVESIEEAIAYSKQIGLNFIAGIELSTKHKNESVHLLGYFRDASYLNKDFREKLHSFKDNRKTRFIKIGKLLKHHFDINLDIDRLLVENEGCLARPHLAREIVKMGIAKNYDEAFDNYLSNDSPAFIQTTKMTVKEGLAFLKKYNCFVSIAHPCLLKKYKISDIFVNGIDAVEAYYPHQSLDKINDIKEFAIQKNILVTAGCDDHGQGISDTKHGNIGGFEITDIEFNNLKNALNLKNL